MRLWNIRILSAIWTSLVRRWLRLRLLVGSTICLTALFSSTLTPSLFRILHWVRLSLKCWNSKKLLELKLFVCLNAQSLLNVIASTYKTFKHIIREWMHSSGNQNMQEGSLSLSVSVCWKCTIYMPLFPSHGFLLSFSFTFEKSAFQHHCSRVFFSAIFILVYTLFSCILFSLNGSPFILFMFVHFSLWLDLSFFPCTCFYLLSSCPYHWSVCLRILTLCCFEFHLNICAYIIEYLYKYTSDFFSLSRSPSNWLAWC